MMQDIGYKVKIKMNAVASSESERGKENFGRLFLIFLFLSLALIGTIAAAHAASLPYSVDVIAPPVTVDVRLTPDDDPVTPGVQVIKPEPGANKTVTIIANVSDKDGWGDIANVTAEISGPSTVEDSPVNLSFDYNISVTTAVYTGSFNMSNHSEGDYKVEVTATDAGGFAGVGSKNFSYGYGIVYAIWANSTKHKDAIHWSGSKNVVRGDVHSNNDVKVSGSSNMIIGTTEYVSKFKDSGKKNTFIPPPIKVSPEPFPVQYNISDYAPGGSEAVAAQNEGKYHYFDKNFHVSGSDVVLDGLYYVEGDAKLSGSNISGVFTIVAEKKIEVSGSKHNCSAYSTNLLLMSGKDEGEDKGEITIAVSKSTFLGVMYTKEGKIEMPGSENTLNGGLFADTVKLSGSKSNINTGQATGGEYSVHSTPTPRGNVILDAIKALLKMFFT